MQPQWRVVRQFSSGSNASLYALDWSACGGWLAAGAVDGTVRVWTVPSFAVSTIVRRSGGPSFGDDSPSTTAGDVAAPQQEALHWTLTVPSKSTARLAPVATFSDHSHYVQGLAFDPRGEFFASQAVDRTVRLYRLTGSAGGGRGRSRRRTWEPDTVIRNGTVVGAAEASVEKPLFLGEHAGIGFFRRLTWTPDGAFLLVPAGVRRTLTNDVATTSFATHLFSRRALSNGPAASFVSPNAPTVAVRCNPVLFAPRPDANADADATGDNATSPPIVAPYRLIFAAATASQVALYDSTLRHPLAVLSDQHYSSVTDLAWSSDGRRLLISSTDGFVTTVRFGEDLLGTPLDQEALEQVEGMSTVQEVRTTSVQVRVRKPRSRKRKADDEPTSTSQSSSTPATADKERGRGRQRDEEEIDDDDEEEEEEDDDDEDSDDDDDGSEEVRAVGKRGATVATPKVHEVQVKRRIQLVPIGEQ